MNILYLHGLSSKLSTEKKLVFQNYGYVFAPNIDYSKKHIQPLSILNDYKTTEFDVVIGSSMGALNAYIIAENIGRPALLFNPPLSRYQSVCFKTYFTKGPAPKHLFLGGSDEVVNPGETLTFLTDHLKESELNLKINPSLGHRIPLAIFEDQVTDFFDGII